MLIAHGNGVTIEYIQKKGSACVEAFREATHLVANFFGDSDRARRSKEVAFQKDLEALVDEMVNKKVHQASKKSRTVWAPKPKPKLDANGDPILPKKAPPRKSAVVDVQVIGAEVWAGKFTEFLHSTAYDPAVKSYPVKESTTNRSGAAVEDDDESSLPLTDSAYDNIDELEHEGHGDMHGDEYETGSASLGGGGEFWTGNVDIVED